MRGKDNMRSGGELLVDQLLVNNVRQVFCVPGESYLAALDAFHDRDIAVTVCRQEGGAVMMAEAVGKLTGRPGIAFVTRGPGATNGSPGLHIARQDSTPVIMFVGQVARDMREREAFQELDYRAVFGTIAKWATEIDDPARIPEIVSRAFHVAMNGRPGPVVIALPEDMLMERVSVADAAAAEAVETWPGLSEMSRLQKHLWAAQKPMMLLGGSRWSEAACAAVSRFAERFDLPVVTTFRRLHLFPALHPCYAGDLGVGPNPKLLARIKAADLVLLVGGRLGEMPSQGYTLLDIPNPQTNFIHVHPDPGELGRVYKPNLAINAAPTAFAAALEGLQPPNEIRWRAETKAAHEDYLAWTEQPTKQPGAVNFGEIMVWLRGALAPDTIFTNGAGNFSAWMHRFYRFSQFATLLGPTSGSMGYGLPAAVAAKRLYPERTVICCAGDGDFLMNGQEFATAVQYDLAVIVLILDNGMYGTIRAHQEREFPGRIIATALRNPDFAAYARAFGGFGAAVERTEDFPAAFKAAQESGKPAILHLKVDPQAISPGTTLDAIREKALAQRSS
jgi:acetolactate synthase-1/2/3 large subunit